VININKMLRIVLYSLLYTITTLIFLSLVLFKSHPLESPLISLLRDVIIFFASMLLLKYTVYMLISPWYEVWRFRTSSASMLKGRYEPLVSVIIPAWNEEVGLLSTVKTLLESSYHPLEIVVVNDGSTDNSDAIMRNFVAKYARAMQGIADAPRLLYYYQANGGKGAALNTGIMLSHGDIIISIDADCIVHRDAVKHFVLCFTDPQVMAAVGNVKIGNTKTLIGMIQHLEYLFSFYFKKADSVMNTIYIIGGAAGAFRREVFQRIGLYSTKNITEDIELSVRIQKAGMRIVYAADAIVYTEGASDLKGLMKQRLRWKRGRFETFREHRSLFFSVKREHNKLLTWVILPLAVFGDMQLGFEPFFLLVLYLFSLVTQDFSAFISGVIVVSLMFFIQIFDDKQTRRLSYLLVAPVGWLLFYLSTIVEFNALLKSLWGLLRKQKLHWQKWQRKGLLDSSNQRSRRHRKTGAQ
jgi:cellulose synthase/poly-beta-1,6-N-acetylglucosamine synthase-like glycosyltransferase